MASATQITANQANAEHSTGPRTDEGKARVSQNALRHGLTARHLVIRDDEHEEFAVLRDSLSSELDPQGAVETIAFQELLHAAWSLHRFRRIEAEASRGTVEDFTDPATTTVLDPSPAIRPAPNAPGRKRSRNSASSRPIAPSAPSN